MIIPGPQLLHQLNADTFDEDNIIHEREDQVDEKTSPAGLGNNNCDDFYYDEKEPAATKPGSTGSRTHEDTPIMQPDKIVIISPLYRLYYAITITVDIGLLSLLYYEFQTKQGNHICQLNSSWTFSSCSVIMASLALIAMVGVHLFLLHHPILAPTEVIASMQGKFDISDSTDAMSEFRKEILSALGSIHAPFPSSPCKGEKIVRDSSNSSTGGSVQSKIFHETNLTQFESCYRLVHAVSRLVVHIDTLLQALQMATGLQLGIGVTSLAVYRVEQSFLNRMRNNNMQSSMYRNQNCMSRLRENLFRVMVQTMERLEDISASLRKFNTVDDKLNNDTTISDEFATLQNLFDLYRVLQTNESTIFSLSFLKSCRRHVASSLSRFTTLFLLSIEAEDSLSSQSAILTKMQKLIQVVTDGTEYLYHALLPYVKSTLHQDTASRASCREKAHKITEIYQLLIKLDAARTLLWCIQENCSFEIEKGSDDATRNQDDKNSLFLALAQSDTERLYQCQKFLMEAIFSTNCLLEKYSPNHENPTRKQSEHNKNEQDRTKIREYSSVHDVSGLTEREDTTTQKMQLFEVGTSSQERYKSNTVSTNPTTNEQNTTLVYSGKGEWSPVTQKNITSSRAEAVDTITSHDAANIFLEELQSRLQELNLPEELNQSSAAKEDASSSVFSLKVPSKFAPFLPLNAKSSLFDELAELQKRMVDNGDIFT